MPAVSGEDRTDGLAVQTLHISPVVKYYPGELIRSELRFATVNEGCCDATGMLRSSPGPAPVGTEVQ